VRKIRDAARELATGNFKITPRIHGSGEFEDIAEALNDIGTRLQQTVSQQASETALIAAERGKLHSVLNSMTDGVFALDHAGRIILFNKAASELTGRSIGEVAGQLAEKVMPFRSHGELVMTRWLASQADTGHQIGHWEGLELYRADGTSLYVDVQAVVLDRDPNGIAALVTFHDLTKQQQLEDMKIDFVALAAHELRTPLTEIKGYLDILAGEAKGLSKANRALLDHAITSAGALSGLMHNLLNVSRIEHGELGYSPEPINYVDFVKDFAADMDTYAKEQKRELKLDLPAHLPVLLADTTAIREVLTNLTDNALKHTTAGQGRITIKVSHHRNEIETAISDNGEGVPADALPRLFTKFYRVGEMKSTTRGTGLGLYICKSIVEAHGGHIWAESSEGEGSTFGFRLPLQPPVARSSHTADNEPTTTITRGAHGWIKNHSVH
jgi:PAS domain S-box-containing protein